jgi:putative ABC transport system permease protein
MKHMPDYGRPRRPARRREIADEVSDELEFHLEMRTREYIARGMNPAEARDRALARFGDLAHVRKTCREIGRRKDEDMRRREYFGELRQDIGFALRQLVAGPGFSLVAILTLALGIGATTAIFSAVNAVVLRPLPIADPDRLVFVTEFWKGQPSDVSAGNFVDMMSSQTSFERAAAIQYASFNVSAGDDPERVIGARVSDGFFDLFGIAPSIGRVFRPDEDQPGSEFVVVLSHRLWTRRFAADRSIVGRDVRIGGRPYQVVGVMPAEFDLTSDAEELWVPIAFTPERKAMHDEHYLTVVARLREGVTRGQAEEQLKTIAVTLRERFPRDNSELGFRVLPFTDTFVGQSRNRLLVLLGAVGLVLLIACGNIANLLLARGTTRSRELAIRAALGAGRGRIVRQLLTESLVLALVAGAVGLAVAWWATRTLVALAPPGVPRLDQTSIDATVLAFTLGLSMVSSIVFGLAPALRSARAGVSDTLKEGGRGHVGSGGRDWLRSALIATEVALAVLLLVGAGLLIRSAIELSRVRPGFNPAGVLTARMTLPAAEYKDSTRAVATFERLAEELGRLPGVTATALASQVPMAPGGNGNGLIPDGKPFDIKYAINARLRMVSPGIFKTLEVPILRGREFDTRDRRGAQKVMIVSQTLANALFAGQDALGRRVACCEPGPDGSPDYKMIVGIAGDMRGRALAAPPPPDFYLPIAQVPAEAWDWNQRTMYIVTRASGGDAMAPLPHLRAVVAAIDPDVPLFSVRTMEERIAESVAGSRFNTLLLSLLGLIGLALSAIGIYGVIAYFVTQRTSEIGVRVALGATRSDVIRLVLRQAAVPIALGLAGGLLASLAATRALASQLVGVERSDPITLASVIGVLAITALAAAFVPARRAAGVDPTQALHAG